MKNNLFSFLVIAGFRNVYVLYINAGQLTANARNMPILIDRSANWNGEVVAITTSSSLKKETMYLSILEAEKKPMAKKDKNSIEILYSLERISSRYGVNLDIKALNLSTVEYYTTIQTL
jgi:hypothetical protein